MWQRESHQYLISLERIAFNDMPIDIDNVVRRDLVGVNRRKFKLGKDCKCAYENVRNTSILE